MAEGQHKALTHEDTETVETVETVGWEGACEHRTYDLRGGHEGYVQSTSDRSSDDVCECSTMMSSRAVQNLPAILKVVGAPGLRMMSIRSTDISGLQVHERSNQPAFVILCCMRAMSYLSGLLQRSSLRPTCAIQLQAFGMELLVAKPRAESAAAMRSFARGKAKWAHGLRA